VYIKLVRNNVKTLYEIRLKTLEPYQQNSLRSHRTRNGKSFKLCITNIKRIVIRQSSYRAFGTQEIKEFSKHQYLTKNSNQSLI
jgi:hypothetical protein